MKPFEDTIKILKLPITLPLKLIFQPIKTFREAAQTTCDFTWASKELSKAAYYKTTSFLRKLNSSPGYNLKDRFYNAICPVIVTPENMKEEILKTCSLRAIRFTPENRTIEDIVKWAVNDSHLLNLMNTYAIKEKNLRQYLAQNHEKLVKDPYLVRSRPEVNIYKIYFDNN